MFHLDVSLVIIYHWTFLYIPFHDIKWNGFYPNHISNFMERINRKIETFTSSSHQFNIESTFVALDIYYWTFSDQSS